MNHVWKFLGLVKSKWIFGAVERAEHRRRTFDEFRTPTQGTRRDELKISGANSCMRVENPIDTALNHERRGISRNFYHSIQKSERCPNFGGKKLDIKMWNMWIARQILTRALPNPIYNLIWEYSRLFHSKPRSRPNKTSAPANDAEEKSQILKIPIAAINLWIIISSVAATTAIKPLIFQTFGSEIYSENETQHFFFVSPLSLQPHRR